MPELTILSRPELVPNDKRVPDKGLRLRVNKRDSYSCIYCDEYTRGIDHVIPWVHSKRTQEDNLVTCCNICNAVKHSKLDPAFLQTALPYLKRLYPESNFLLTTYVQS